MVSPLCSLCAAPVEEGRHRCARCRVRLGLACPECGSVSPTLSRFCGACGQRLPSPATFGGLTSEDALERRHVTVVFCDLVGSTALASSMDVEDYNEIIRSVLRRLTEVVEDFGGLVGQYLGDGTLNYFGYPSANENDTANAVAAALAMVSAVSSLSTAGGLRLEARAGVAAGNVIIGDIVGMGGTRSLDVAGELPSLAARLQHEAKPGSVIIDDSVHQIIGYRFACQSLGKHILKGWADPVMVWRVTRPLAALGRAAGRYRTHLSPLIGRADALAQLTDAWRQARAGTGAGILVLGEAGIGKSRLLAELLRVTAHHGHARIMFRFNALQQGAPLGACLPAIERAAGFRPGDSAPVKRAKIGIALPSMPDSDFELIAGLLGVPGQSKALQGSPRKQLERTIAALLQAVVLTSKKQPLLIAVEDLHWSDPTSAELLAHLVQHAASYPILLVLTSRPDGVPAIIQPGLTAVRLNPLDHDQSHELVGWIKGAEALSGITVQDITRRCDGIPLYLEEITKAAVEGASQPPHCAEPESRTASRGPMGVPSTIHSSLLARLDQLGSARNLAEIASAIGRDFGLDLLASIANEPRETLRPVLSKLIASGLVVSSSAEGRELRFKHVLLQDAAYGMITRKQRMSLHARIAAALEADFPALAAAEPQLLAHHYTEAERPDHASRWWLQAGIQSLMRSATAEALAQLSQGLAAVEMLPRTPERDQAALNLRIAYSKALIATQGYAAVSTGEAFAVARAQCERLGHPPQFLTVLHGQWSHSLFRGDIREAKRQADWILAAAEARQDPSWRLVGCYAIGITSLPLGDFSQSCAMIRRGLVEFAAQSGKAYAGPIVPDPVIVMRTYLSWALMCMGRMDEARDECALALERADLLGQTFSAAFALWHEAYLISMTVSVEAALPRMQALRRLATEHGITFYEATTTLYEGWIHAVLGRTDEGLRLIRQGCLAHAAFQNRLYLSSYLRLEAEVLGMAGRLEEARLLLLDADRRREELGADWDAPEFMRVKGELLWAAGQTANAESVFQGAIALAKSRSARLFALSAALAYAERLVVDGRPYEALVHLEPTVAALHGLGSFTMLETAQNLLKSLQSLHCRVVAA